MEEARRAEAEESDQTGQPSQIQGGSSSNQQQQQQSNRSKTGVGDPISTTQGQTQTQGQAGEGQMGMSSIGLPSNFDPTQTLQDGNLNMGDGIGNHYDTLFTGDLDVSLAFLANLFETG